jgi:hypothetical protein
VQSQTEATRLACRLWAVVVATERWRAEKPEIPSSHCRSGKSRRRGRRVAVFKSSRRGRRRWRSAGLQLQWGWCSCCLCRLICRRLGCSRHHWPSSVHRASVRIRSCGHTCMRGPLLPFQIQAFFLLAFHKRDVETSVAGPCLLICSYFFLYA